MAITSKDISKHIADIVANHSEEIKIDLLRQPRRYTQFDFELMQASEEHLHKLLEELK